MDEREELFSEILKRVQRNYVHMAEVERLTKELGESLSRNDQESVQLLLRMRQDELDEIETSKQEIQMFLQPVTEEERRKIKSWLQGENRHQPDSFESKKILEISGQMQQVLARTINIDKAINLKLAGKDSFYQAAT